MPLVKDWELIGPPVGVVQHIGTNPSARLYLSKDTIDAMNSMEAGHASIYGDAFGRWQDRVEVCAASLGGHAFHKAAGIELQAGIQSHGTSHCLCYFVGTGDTPALQSATECNGIEKAKIKQFGPGLGIPRRNA